MSRIDIEYGAGTIPIEVPARCDIRAMGAAVALSDPAAAIRDSLVQPIGCPPLAELARSRLAADPRSNAVVVVSDNTRPVPYRGDGGILIPLLATLRQAGYSDDRITLLIGAGSHRDMSKAEIEAMLGIVDAGFNVPVVNHDYEKLEELVLVGETRRGSPVRINRLYVEADLKIVTGLVESHFMAGASGGRKAICPAIASKETLRIFHGPEILQSPASADLVLEGNPCSEEAEQAAELAGCDFSVNVTLDSAKRITGVYSGDITGAHRAAVARIREYVVVPLDRRYDLVVIPGGFVAVNHYQAAKAAIEASRAVKPGGMIVVVARHSDPDPVGSGDYKTTLSMLKRSGPKKFLEAIKSPEWIFTHDQWETQMWGKVLEVIGNEENLIYCSLDIPEQAYSYLPGVPGVNLLKPEERVAGRPAEELMRLMVERALEAGIGTLQRRLGRDPEVLFLPDGPYGVPEIAAPSGSTSS
jgi:nickel-dependent lactate racemase